MVVYDLICETKHCFEGWFKDQTECLRQMDSGLLACPYCDSKNVQRLPSATHIRKLSAKRDPASEPAEAVQQRAVHAMVEKLHHHIESHYENVGAEFAAVARSIHETREPQRNIRGTATGDEIAELHEDGIAVLALPPLADKTKLN